MQKSERPALCSWIMSLTTVALNLCCMRYVMTRSKLSADALCTLSFAMRARNVRLRPIPWALSLRRL